MGRVTTGLSYRVKNSNTFVELSPIADDQVTGPLAWYHAATEQLNQNEIARADNDWYYPRVEGNDMLTNNVMPNTPSPFLHPQVPRDIIVPQFGDPFAGEELGLPPAFCEHEFGGMGPGYDGEDMNGVFMHPMMYDPGSGQYMPCMWGMPMDPAAGGSGFEGMVPGQLDASLVVPGAASPNGEGADGHVDGSQVMLEIGSFPLVMKAMCEEAQGLCQEGHLILPDGPQGSMPDGAGWTMEGVGPCMPDGMEQGTEAIIPDGVSAAAQVWQDGQNVWGDGITDASGAWNGEGNEWIDGAWEENAEGWDSRCAESWDQQTEGWERGIEVTECQWNAEGPCNEGGDLSRNGTGGWSATEGSPQEGGRSLSGRGKGRGRKQQEREAAEAQRNADRLLGRQGADSSDSLTPVNSGCCESQGGGAVLNGPVNYTTVMLRNIPNKYTREMLVKQLNQDFRGGFDFVYLPIDFKNRCNVGYGFINFRTVDACEIFVTRFNGVDVRKCLPGLNSRKVAEVTPARVQGLDENVRRLRNSPVMNELVLHPEWMPLLLDEGGEESAFPLPEQPCPPVKPRRRGRDERG